MGGGGKVKSTTPNNRRLPRYGRQNVRLGHFFPSPPCRRRRATAFPRLQMESGPVHRFSVTGRHIFCRLRTPPPPPRSLRTRYDITLYLHGRPRGGVQTLAACIMRTVIVTIVPDAPRRNLRRRRTATYRRHFFNRFPLFFSAVLSLRDASRNPFATLAAARLTVHAFVFVCVCNYYLGRVLVYTPAGLRICSRRAVVAFFDFVPAKTPLATS